MARPKREPNQFAHQNIDHSEEKLPCRNSGYLKVRGRAKCAIFSHSGLKIEKAHRLRAVIVYWRNLCVVSIQWLITPEHMITPSTWALGVPLENCHFSSSSDISSAPWWRILTRFNFRNAVITRGETLKLFPIQQKEVNGLALIPPCQTTMLPAH